MTVPPALGNIHLLPLSSHGMVGDWLPGQHGRLGFCRRNSCAYLLRSYSIRTFHLSLLSPLPVTQVFSTNAFALETSPARKLVLPTSGSDDYLELLACFRCRHYFESELQVGHGSLCHQSLRIWWSYDLGLHHLFRDREMVLGFNLHGRDRRTCIHHSRSRVY